MEALKRLLTNASHDIDDDFNTQINIMFARGLLVESTKPIWMYGTAVEHATTYQYQFNNAKGLIASMIQTESPYFQGLNGIGAIAPFGGNMGEFPGDPPGGIDRCLHGGVGKYQLCPRVLLGRVQRSWSLV